MEVKLLELDVNYTNQGIVGGQVTGTGRQLNYKGIVEVYVLELDVNYTNQGTVGVNVLELDVNKTIRG